MMQSVNGRRVFVVDRHQEVLPAWIAAAHEAGAPPALITLDFHADLRPAFHVYAASLGGEADLIEPRPDEADMRDLIARSRLQEVDIAAPQSVQAAVADLWHDEHIDCALRLGVIAHAFVLLSWRKQWLDHDGASLFNFEPCYAGCARAEHDDPACWRRRADLVIDDRRLAPALAAIAARRDLHGSPFILDIDLDVFNTRAAIAPHALSCFRWLIRNAALITLAREKACVEDADYGCRLEEGVAAAELEAALIAHIEAA